MSTASRPTVLHTVRADDVARLTASGMCAVVLASQDGCPWAPALADAVTAGRLVIPRTTLTAVGAEEFTAWVHSAVADAPAAVMGPLVADMTGIVTRVMEVTGVDRVMVRAFTEAPTRRCGFHVDTVPAQAPTVGALRVYNGATTEYVEPDDVLSTDAFNAYLSRRERLSRAAVGAGIDDPLAGAARAELATMDESPSFLRSGAVIHRVPPDATVYFRHLDVRRHWSTHPVAEAWIHRSPMHGQPRLVLNVSPAQPVSSSRSGSRPSSAPVSAGFPGSSGRGK
ncbi:DUF1826 domain-containing protein [Streptomyces sp. NPDC001118]